MEEITESQKFWSNTQAYALATICLLSGIAVGYLLHLPKKAELNVPQAPSVTGAMNEPMPTFEELKRMADKQAAPLLAELQRHPKDSELLAKLGSTYFAARQFQTAQQYYEQSLAIKADPVVLNELSFCYYSLGDIDKAIVALNRALKVDPNNAKALFNLGMFQWYGKTDPKAAVTAWERFLEANPNDPRRAQVEQMIARARLHLNIPSGTKTDKPAM